MRKPQTYKAKEKQMRQLNQSEATAPVEQIAPVQHQAPIEEPPKAAPSRHRPKMGIIPKPDRLAASGVPAKRGFRKIYRTPTKEILRQMSY
jgi:hypothetical protein